VLDRVFLAAVDASPLSADEKSEIVRKIYSNYTFPRGLKAFTLKQECLRAVSAKKLVSVINSVLRNITLSRQSHVNTLATTGEYKEYANRDVQNLIHQYSGRRKRNVYIPYADRLSTYLRKLKTIKDLKIQYDDCSFLVGYGELIRVNSYTFRGNYVKVILFNITNDPIHQSIEIEYEPEMSYVVEKIIAKYSNNENVFPYIGDYEPISIGDELPESICIRVNFPSTDPLPVLKKVISTIIKIASKPPL
jgi:hypothetical protein